MERNTIFISVTDAWYRSLGYLKERAAGAPV